MVSFSIPTDHLSQGPPPAQAALVEARRGEAQRIAAEIREHRLVGVLGEGGVGKTQTVGQALGSLPKPPRTIYLDLNQAPSNEHAGFLIARAIARTLLNEKDFALLRRGILVPVSAELQRSRLVELLGVELVEEGLRVWPSGTLPSSTALAGLERLLAQEDIVLWIDHIEAPLLTPRHPLDPQRLLAEVYELCRRAPRLRVVVCAREALRQQLLTAQPEGSWLTLDVPSPPTWQEVANRLATPADSSTVARLVQLTGGHPATMLPALEALTLAGAQQQSIPELLLQDLALRDSSRAANALQQARTLHRLGGHLLGQIALGQRPYERSRRGSSSSQEIRKVLNRLHLAGLLRRTDRWAITDPLVALQLRDPLPLQPPGAS